MKNRFSVVFLFFSLSWTGVRRENIGKRELNLKWKKYEYLATLHGFKCFA